MSETTPLPEFDFVILGGGIAGLAFALEATEKGFTVLVLEKDKQIGGLSRTLDYKGFRFDYSAHRFHSANPLVLNRVKGIMGARFKRYMQRSRILMFGRYLKYPFELQNLIRAMPVSDAIFSSINFALTQIKKTIFKLKGNKNIFLSYEDWFIYHFGKRLYQVMCLPYTTKIWKTKPTLLSADWADQRFQGINIKKLIKKTIAKLIRLDFSSYSLEDEKLVPDGGEFYYPPTGAQEIPDKYGELIKQSNGEIITLALVNGVDTTTKTVTYKDKKDQIDRQVKYKRALISTIPLHSLYNALGKNELDILQDLDNLKYMNIIFIYLLLDKEQVSKDHWLYFPDKEIIFNRSVEFKSWSSEMAPAGKTALCLDITCFEGDETWGLTNDELKRQTIDGAIKAGLIKESDIFDSLVVRIKDAYPFYDLDYKRKLINIVQSCEASGDLFCLGRSGLFQYNNSDGSIEMGMELANILCADDWHKDLNTGGLLNYKFRHISY